MVLDESVFYHAPAIVEIVEIARSLAKNDTFHTETSNKSITSGK